MQQCCLADGFPIRPRSFLVSPSVTYFFANKGWDSLRVLRPFARNGQFSSMTYSLYAEYGISRRWSLVASLPYVMNQYAQTDSTGRFATKSNGLTDLETGLRYYLANINYRFYFMLQGTVITPLYTNLALGYGLTGAELKLSFAGSGRFSGGTGYYFTVENGVRQYFGSNGPWQDRYNGTFGLTLDQKFMNQLSVSLGGIYSASNFKKFSVNPAVNKNFAFNQVTLSYGHSFTRGFSVFVSGGTFINGRNTGDGSSVSVSLVMRTF